MDIVAKLQSAGGIVALLGLVIFVHEFGHFAVAKLLGMRVFVFSFGFGRRLLGFTWRETDYRLSLLPLGGYVRLEGEPEDFATGDPSQEARALDDGTLVSVENPDYFTNRPRWQRILVYLAGPLMNVVLTVGVLTAFFLMGAGAPAPRKPVVGSVQPGSPAAAAGLATGDLVESLDGRRVPDWDTLSALVVVRPDTRYAVRVQRGGGAVQELQVQAGSEPGPDGVRTGRLGVLPGFEIVRFAEDSAARDAGLKAGDIVMSADGQPVASFEQLVEAVGRSAGRPMALVIWRDGRSFDQAVTPRKLGNDYKLGIGFPDVMGGGKMGFTQAVGQAFRFTWAMTRLTLDTLGQLVTGRLSPKTLSGPIGIARASAQAAREGSFEFFRLLAFISLQVGLLNVVLPFVPFDGGHLALLVLESAMRRDLSERARNWVMNAGLGVVLLLIVLVFYSDLSKISFFGKFLP